MSEHTHNNCPIVIAAPAQAFFHLVITPYDEYFKLAFSVKDETNIRYYLIEGSDDMITFHRLTRILALGATDLPRTYNATIYDTAYRYYRIRQVDNASAAVTAAHIMPWEENTLATNKKQGPNSDGTKAVFADACLMY